MDGGDGGVVEVDGGGGNVSMSLFSVVIGGHRERNQRWWVWWC